MIMQYCNNNKHNNIYITYTKPCLKYTFDNTTFPRHCANIFFTFSFDVI